MGLTSLQQHIYGGGISCPTAEGVRHRLSQCHRLLFVIRVRLELKDDLASEAMVASIALLSVLSSLLFALGLRDFSFGPKLISHNELIDPQGRVADVRYLCIEQINVLMNVDHVK